MCKGYKGPFTFYLLTTFNEELEFYCIEKKEHAGWLVFFTLLPPRDSFLNISFPHLLPNESTCAALL